MREALSIKTQLFIRPQKDTEKQKRIGVLKIIYIYEQI